MGNPNSALQELHLANDWHTMLDSEEQPPTESSYCKKNPAPGHIDVKAEEHWGREEHLLILPVGQNLLQWVYSPGLAE